MLVATLGLLLMGTPLDKSVLPDLNSPIYAVREKARKALHASFVATDRTKWNGLRALLVQGEGKSANEIIAAASEDFGVKIEIEPEGYSCTRLDRDWVLNCSYSKGTLVDARLKLEPPIVTPNPPADYTGVWRSYREDGSIESETYYMHGKPGGPLNDGGDID